MNAVFRRPAVAAVVILALLAAVTVPGTPGAGASAGPATQPTQPVSGPGGSKATNASYRVSHGGLLDNAWYVFEPTTPTPRSAPVTIITHGYFEFADYATMQGLVEHTVRTGSIVIYPRWQTTPVTACPGPFNIEPCIASEVAGIKGALQYLRKNPTRVQPDVSRTSYFGFSFGGIITANIANRYQSLGLPKPRAIFLDDPHDGGYAGTGEPALDDSLAGIPSTTLFQCHVGASGVTSEAGKRNSSCNAVFPRLTSIPPANKDLVMSYDDDHGSPALSSAHGVSTGGPRKTLLSGTPDAYDWNFVWKVWDALRDAALTGKNRAYALGNTPQHRNMGTWSDGTPVTPLKITKTAPITP